MKGGVRRVALFTTSLAGGGAERVMLRLAQGLTERGLDVDLVLSRASGPCMDEVPSSVRLVDLHAPRIVASLPALIGYLRRERPSVMLSALNAANVVALLARRLARVPIRVVVAEHSTPSRAATGSSDLRKRIMPLLMRWTYPWADAVVAVSNGVAQDLLRVVPLHRSSLHVIYNPVVTPELFTKAEETVDHPWFAPEQPPVILAVGRLTPAKDFPTLIRAFAVVRKTRQARLMILGEGEERSRLERLVGKLGLDNDVALPGYVSNPYKFMSRAAVFVLSSRWEGLPTVLIEALALGTPVVSTNCPSGPVEILENGRWGRLVPVGNPEKLAEAILQVLQNPRRASRDVPAVRRFEQVFATEQYLRVLGIGDA